MKHDWITIIHAKQHRILLWEQFWLDVGAPIVSTGGIDLLLGVKSHGLGVKKEIPWTQPHRHLCQTGSSLIPTDKMLALLRSPSWKSWVLTHITLPSTQIRETNAKWRLHTGFLDSAVPDLYYMHSWPGVRIDLSPRQGKQCLEYWSFRSSLMWKSQVVMMLYYGTWKRFLARAHIGINGLHHVWHFFFRC